MNRLLLILILTLSFQSSTKADDIRDFEIEGISIGDSALIYFSEKLIKKNSRSPYKDKKEIVKKLDKMFINVEKMSNSKDHEADPTGNSKQHIDQYNINYPDHIRVECTKFSEQMKNDGLAQNSLNMVVMTKEINDWIASGYK